MLNIIMHKKLSFNSSDAIICAHIIGSTINERESYLSLHEYDPIPVVSCDLVCIVIVWYFNRTPWSNNSWS